MYLVIFTICILLVGYSVNRLFDEFSKPEIEIEDSVYNQIEDAVIRWDIEGNRTAGDLTREIITILKQEEIL